MANITTRNQQMKQQDDFIRENFTKLNNKMDVITERNTEIKEEIRQMKDVIIQNLVNSNKALQNTVKNLQERINKIEKREKDLTVNTEKHNQYGRRNNIEISGISNDIEDDMLEEKVIKILEKIDVNVEQKDIEACHRLPPTKRDKTKKTIIRFVNRKVAEKSLSNKKKLQNINKVELELPNTPLYIGENLNDHYRELAWMCRRLRKENLIYSYKFQNECFLVKARENSDSRIKVFHKDDLLKYYNNFFNPEVEETSTQE